ncbi:MAG: hypothetical protein ACI4PO_09450 [Faecousia sp.]
MIIEMSSCIIGKNIHFLREKYELPTIALSKLTSIPEPCIQAMEKELYVPPMTEYQLNRLCEVLNISMKQLVHEEIKDATNIQFRNQYPYNAEIKL